MVTRPIAYRVPFRVERDYAAGSYRLINISREVVHGVSFTLHGSGVMAISPPRMVRPGHGIEVSIATRNPARNTILVVRWFRPNGMEYLWRVAF
jgi:hypothetical protein